MIEETPYNPLDKRNLGVSVADALLERPILPLPPADSFVGAGIYAIYYVGNFVQVSLILRTFRERPGWCFFTTRSHVIQQLYRQSLVSATIMRLD